MYAILSAVVVKTFSVNYVASTEIQRWILYDNLNFFANMT